ncbi:MAG: aspartyl-phosphate phosphatase Spo0E family protein [Bacillaceae bacterium]|nr:aspartyl-phosphate phosphatase Spo0E family protein [Bacillaceae bacterium]
MIESKINEIELLRNLLYASVQNNGISNPDTIKLSQALDEKMNYFLSFTRKAEAT